ncbi:NAD(P)H-binding protein [Rhodococcus sp. IEGM 1401]|uniref:NAD(P)H-binding protein n=1 Tax=unclassified Rhodococcus (in: high G+C Gram-positive bacteria) TaxID=192944 RepID=UPI0022B2F66C|nr:MULTISPECIES: NAD(P)H-binding protein [unclassified Rhodococcus (in: high G+C Gram-positive bacteria)]MCZ4561007.1 NAD(P)H-binding protein [Rhodococcus sp. IEGM 1401]MDI9921087.1 NAD(P)H-binding protein [Rhodococcus sp. IEGM 1372]MDV8033540.1 NAD(P)H-binding protein [Rhodococcus sp. IEGM 1414]
MTDKRIVIAGGHGQIAQHLTQVLTAHGDRAVSLIRNSDHVDAVTALGALPQVIDLESASVDEVAAVLADADAVVFAAGAGPNSGPERKDTVDRAGAVLLADAAEKAGVRRYVLISSFGAGERVAEDLDAGWKAYIEAKTAAEENVSARSGLDWTILRPGKLTDEDPTGSVSLTEPPLDSGEVTRADVAAVIAQLLDTGSAVRKTLMLTSGPTSIVDAVDALG